MVRGGQAGEAEADVYTGWGFRARASPKNRTSAGGWRSSRGPRPRPDSPPLPPPGARNGPPSLSPGVFAPAALYRLPGFRGPQPPQPRSLSPPQGRLVHATSGQLGSRPRVPATPPLGTTALAPHAYGFPRNTPRGSGHPSGRDHRPRAQRYGLPRNTLRIPLRQEPQPSRPTPPGPKNKTRPSPGASRNRALEGRY